MEKQYLNEENYQKANQKIKKVALIILILGLLIGGGLIAFGAIKQIEANKINEERAAAAQAKVDADIAAAKTRLDEIKKEVATLEAEESAKELECDSLDMMADGWFAERNKCQQEVSAIRSKINDLDMEQFELENDEYTVYYDMEQPIKYVPFYMFGAFCIIGGAMIGGAIWIITKRRAIRAYSAQQTLPVNKEIINEYSDPIADAAGKVASAVKQSPNNTPKTDKE